MTDIQLLKRLNFWEKLGWLLLKKKKKLFIFIAVILLVIFLISSIQSFIALDQKHTAEQYIAKSELQLDKVNESINEISDRLAQNSKLFKEYNLYIEKIDDEKEQYNNLSSELDDIQKDLEDKEIDKVMVQFESDGEGKDVFSEKITAMENSLASLNKETTDVIEMDQYLVSQYPKFKKYNDALDDRVKARYDNLNVIETKAKTASVKDKANIYFTRINENKNSFIDELKKLKVYTKTEQGTFTVKELKQIKKKYLGVASLLENTDSSFNIFDEYWDELHEQYYTIVKKQYHELSTDYVTEPNPDYKEWTETETYEDTETYTEKEYVGSRIVDDEKEDIYEEVTKTRPVTRTRTVTKDNGEPTTISVPYDVYTFYYTVEKHTPYDVTESSVEVGEKHEKYDSSIQNWSYDEDESVGYVEWKQLWNDNTSIIRGKNISPSLE